MEVLRVDRNGFGNEGALALAHCLHKFKRIDVRYCSINVDGQVALSVAIRRLSQSVAYYIIDHITYALSGVYFNVFIMKVKFCYAIYTVLRVADNVYTKNGYYSLSENVKF